MVRGVVVGVGSVPDDGGDVVSFQSGLVVVDELLVEDDALGTSYAASAPQFVCGWPSGFPCSWVRYDDGWRRGTCLAAVVNSVTVDVHVGYPGVGGALFSESDTSYLKGRTAYRVELSPVAVDSRYHRRAMENGVFRIVWDNTGSSSGSLEAR